MPENEGYWEEYTESGKKCGTAYPLGLMLGSMIRIGKRVLVSGPR
jgi:hypothetical protein